MKIQFQAKAYLQNYTSIEDVVNGTCLPLIALGASTYYEKEGYPIIGDVTVIIDLYTEDEIITGKISALKSQLQTVRADNHMREKQITDKIAKLLAITISPTTKEI